MIAALICSFGPVWSNVMDHPHAASSKTSAKPTVVEIYQSWYATLGTSDVPQLKEAQPGVAMIENAGQFAAVWNMMIFARPAPAKTPEVDFSKHSVIIVRNVEYENRIIRTKATLMDGVLTVSVRQTRTARQVTDLVHVAMIVVPSEGIRTAKLK